jgi:Raf kinase inhibitor-like YbhB/YbcL family protein
MELTSSAFAGGQPIPSRHSCEAEDLSPELAWTGVPAATLSLALVVDDPDAPAGTFTHWLAWGIDPGAGRLGEGAHPPFEGRNDFGTVGYRGPCPPPGHGPHRYCFRLNALESELGLGAGANREELERLLEGQLLESAELVGSYGRR